MEWIQLLAQLRADKDYSANKELASRVARNDARAVNFYLTDIGFPIARYIEYNITHTDVVADLYMFLSDPFDKETQLACWHRVSLYNGNNCKLSTYTSNIACRHFCKLTNQEKTRKLKNGELLEYVDYESLLKCETAETDDDNPQLAHVRKAYYALSEKDRETLRLLIIEKKSGLEAFPFLSQFITPRAANGRSPEEIMALWTNKQRQDAMALLKGRALEHLQLKFKEERNK